MRTPCAWQVQGRAGGKACQQNLGLKRCADPTFTSFLSAFSPAGIAGFLCTAHFPRLRDRALRSDPCRLACLHNIGITTTSALGAVAISLNWSGHIAVPFAGGWPVSVFQEIPFGGDLYGRTVIAALFIMLPITPVSVILFLSAMGRCGLARCPLTVFGRAYLWAALYGHAVEFGVSSSHQWAAFLGVCWAAADVTNAYGDYTVRVGGIAWPSARV